MMNKKFVFNKAVAGGIAAIAAAALAFIGYKRSKRDDDIEK